MDIRKV